jgi:signal transduction histidine kinase
MLPLVVENGAIFGALQLEGAAPFDELDLFYANSIVNQLAIAVDRQAATAAKQAATEVAEREQRLLAQVGEVVTSSLDRRATLAAVARAVVPLFADLCIIDEVAEDGAVQRLEVVFSDEHKQRDLADQLRRFSPRPGWTTPDAKVLESGEPLLFPEITDPGEVGIAHDEEHATLLRATSLTSMMVLALRARDRTLGVLTLARTESGERYATRDLALGRAIAQRAALSVDNARLYEQAQQATRARENLLAVISHDLRSPLGAILMGIDMLLKLPAGEDRRRSRKHLERIERSAQRMKRLVEDLLDAASLDAGGLSVETGRVAAQPLVLEALDALQPVAESKSLRLGSELPADLPGVSADAARLQQVLANLLGNAIKFTPEGGTITVRAKPSGDTVTFSVSDTGPGIAGEYLPRLFERFWQVKRTASLGIGLGLFIVKGIVEAHGGRIWVESKAGEGSTFFFTLPVAAADEDQAPAGAGASGGKQAIPPRRPDVFPSEVARHAAELEALTHEVELRKRELYTLLESTRVARELAARAGELERDFMNVVSHELRAPLTALELLIERMQRDRENPLAPRQQQIIQRMFSALARLSAMIESLLRRLELRGHAELESEVGHGSTFIVTLPPVDQALQEQGVPLQSGSGAARVMAKRILIVEDDADIREDLADFLRADGYDVVTTENGRAARDWLQHVGVLPDVILLDLMMPVMDGWQFRAEQLQDTTLARIPVVVLSGAGDVRREATALGAAGYVAKPFKLDSLLGVVHQAVA